MQRADSRSMKTEVRSFNYLFGFKLQIQEEMGSGSSTVARHSKLGNSQQAIVKLMMPLYFDPIDCTLAEHKLAEDCWNLVLTDQTPEFLAKKGTEGFPYTSCVTFFYDSFYVRLFDIHPAAKELFKSGMKGQGKFLVMMLSLALSELTQPAQFDKSLLRLADVHYKRGVKAVEYGVVGDVLFWTLRKVTGEAYYTLALHKVWVKIYSRMLKTLIPAAVAQEMQGESEEATRRDVSSMFADQPTTMARDSFSDGETLSSQKILDRHKLKLLSEGKEISTRPVDPVHTP